MKFALLVVILSAVLASACTQYQPATTTTQAPTTTQAQVTTTTAASTPTTAAQQTTTTIAAKQFSISADDSSYSPTGSINVNKGDIVRITFNVKTTGVNFGGLDFRSSEFDTGTIKPGGSKTVEFVADSSFSISSYWPGSNTKKPYTIEVVVQ